MRELTKNALSLGWGFTVLGMQEVSKLMRGAPGSPHLSLPVEDQLEDLYKAAFEAGDHVQREMIDGVSSYLDLDALYKPNTMFRLGSDLILDLPNMLRFFVPNSEGFAAWQEILNKLEVYRLVRSVEEKLKVPRDEDFNLADYVDRAYDLGPFEALWAVEGLGHDYADAVTENGGEPRKLLTGKQLESVPDKSWLMLHAGIGLSFAQQLMVGLDSKTSVSELGETLETFIRWSSANSNRGYQGAALESLGLVTRTFHSELVPAVDRYLSENHVDVAAYFWHGVGRATYFLLVNFLPYRDPVWRAVEMGTEEASTDLARKNSLAGTAWALTLVNMRTPTVMKAVIENYGEELLAEDSFKNGVTSSIIMRLDTAPDDPHVDTFRDYRPDTEDLRMNELWDQLIKDPVEKAQEVHHRYKKENKLDTVFCYQEDLAGV